MYQMKDIIEVDYTSNTQIMTLYLHFFVVCFKCFVSEFVGTE